MKLRLYNTEKRQKEEIVPMDGKTIKMYTCGPTVYNFAHIGNFRTYVFEDLLRRVIKYYGYDINQVMNLTDVDDKTIKGAILHNISLDAFTEIYKKAFFEDLSSLNIEKVEHYPEATHYIPQMIKIIQTLLNKGSAYLDKEGNVYFSIAKFPTYGRLSHLKLDELQAGASDRVAVDEYEKDSISDFVLWKAYDKERDGNHFWQSPFGPGRPGWHIECSAMAMEILGESIDIHVGGVDNMFPHHENEIAQCEACTGKVFVKHWLHSEHLLVGHKKMSKSLGNFFTLRDLLAKGYSGQIVRYALLSTHYRSQLNFTLQGLDAAKASLERIQDCIDRLKNSADESDFEAKELIDSTRAGFKQALFDDLNISEALSKLFEMIRQINILGDAKKLGKKAKDAFLAFFKEIDQVLGFLPLKELKEDLTFELEEALRLREKARQEKNWKESDKYRNFIIEHGYLIEDTPNGPRLKKRVNNE